MTRFGVIHADSHRDCSGVKRLRAPVGRSDARDAMGLTAVAYSTTLSASFVSVSLRISICGLTNTVKLHYPPANRQPRESEQK